MPRSPTPHFLRPPCADRTSCDNQQPPNVGFFDTYGGQIIVNKARSQVRPHLFEHMCTQHQLPRWLRLLPTQPLRLLCPIRPLLAPCGL